MRNTHLIKLKYLILKVNAGEEVQSPAWNISKNCINNYLTYKYKSYFEVLQRLANNIYII